MFCVPLVWVMFDEPSLMRHRLLAFDFTDDLVTSNVLILDCGINFLSKLEKGYSAHGITSSTVLRVHHLSRVD